MPRYAAFISYSHADERWARWLQRSIERYRVPRRIRVQAPAGHSVPARLVPVFRDRDELATASDLTAAIQTALGESDALLVVCSPAAAASKWVNAEIRRFQALGRSDRIFCMIVAGRSDRDAPDCAFPPALLNAEGGSPLPSPLAVNPDERADGRRGALLKIVAALLRIRVDDLRRRDYQRQVRFWSAVAVGALGVSAATVTLAIYAQLAREEADLRRGQAEGLIGFMLGDLRQKLEPIGRLDLLDAVGDEALRYFAAVGDQATGEERLSRAMALRQIGEVRGVQGRLEEASEAFEESLRQATRLFELSPDNNRYLFELAQAEFWVGQTAYERNDLDAAAAALGRYMERSRVLAEREPGNPDYQLELSYAYSNLGTLARERGRPGEALDYFGRGADLERRLLEADPGNTALRLALAESLSWSGTCLLDLGRLAQSEASFRRSLALLRDLHESADNRRHDEEYADLGALLAGVLAQRGAVEEAMAHLRRSLRVYVMLNEHDPANARWQQSRLRGERLLLDLEFAGGARGDSATRLRALREAFGQLAAADPGNARLQQDLALTERLHALALREAGEEAAALVLAGQAHERLARVTDGAGRESLALNAALVAETRGRLLQAAGRTDQATALLGEALAAVAAAPGSGTGLVHRALQSRLLALLGRHEEAGRMAAELRAAGFADPRMPLPPDAA